MRERAELVGGTIEFARPAEGGTIVRLRVPLEEPDGQGAVVTTPDPDRHDG
jgi:nitrate/nitrite-specific signal transduction histidine kinase